MDGWQVTSVAAEWEDGESDDSVQWQQEGAYLSVWLDHGLSETRPRRLTIAAVKSLSPADKRLRPQQLRVLRMQNAEQGRRVSHIWTRRPFRLRVEGNVAAAVRDASAATTEDRQRLGQRNPTGLLWSGDAEDDEFAIVVLRDLPQFGVANDVTINVRRDKFRYEYRVGCRPRSRGVDRLIVNFTQANCGPQDWRIAGLEGHKVVKRQLSDAEKGEIGLPRRGAAWEVSWSRTLREPFQLVGHCELPVEPEHGACLISIPTAAEQSGRLTIRNVDGADPVLNNVRLAPLPVPPQPWGSFATVCGHYRYDPTGDTAVDEPALVIGTAETPEANHRAIVWRGTFLSRIERDTQSTHVAILEIENFGARRMTIRVPNGLDVHQAMIDEHPIPLAPADDNARLTLRLPHDRRFVKVEIVYSSGPARAVLPWCYRSDDLPLETDLPVLTRRHRIFAPNGFTIVDSLDGGPYGKKYTWRERVFGWLARSSGGKVFDPFDWSTWSYMVPPDASHKAAEFGTVEPLSLWDGGRDSRLTTRDVWVWSAPSEYAGSKSGVNVYLVDQHRMRALCWTVGLVVLIAWWRWWPRRVSTRLALASLLVVLALLLPGIVAPLATSAVAGTAAAFIGRVLAAASALMGLRKFQTPAAAQFARLPTIRTGSSTFKKFEEIGKPLGLLLSGTFLFHAFMAMAQDDLVPQRTQIHPVYIPIDKDRKVVGDSYYVSQTFLDLLHRKAAPTLKGQSNWMISGADYSGSLKWNVDRSQLRLTELTVTYDLEVYRRRTTVRIPLGAGEPAPDSMNVTLDGKPVDVRQQGNSDELVLQVPEPGTYSLVIPLRPATEVVGMTSRLDLAIPPLATASLSLAVPGDAPAIEVPSALGPLTRDRSRRRVAVELGPTKRLDLRWSHGTSVGEDYTLDVDQLLMLNLEPGAVVVRAKLKLDVSEGTVRQLRVALDPGLNPLPLELTRGGNEQAGIKLVRTNSADRQEIMLEFDRPVTGRQTVELAFLVRDVVGVGNVRLPYLEVKGARSSRHWVAISADALLEVDVNDVPANPALVAVERASLVDRWELGEAEPVLCYRQTRSRVDWNFPSRSRRPTTKGTQRLSLSYGRRKIDVRLDADLDTSGGYLFQHRVKLPPDLDVVQVSVWQDGEQRDRRWTQRDRLLSVFLSAPVTGSHRLRVVGELTRRQDVPSIPVLELQDSKLHEVRYAIYRQPGVLVKTPNGPGLVAATDTSSEPALAEFGRLVAVYRQTEGMAPAEVAVRSNDPKVDAVQVVRLVQVGNEWFAELDLNMQVESGIVDSLKLEIPESWQELVAAETGDPYDVNRAAGRERKTVVVRPRTAVKGEYQVRIRGRLKPGAGNRVSLPDVKILNLTGVERYAVLPVRIDGRDVRWETSGMEPQALPDGSQGPLQANTTFQSFRVVEEVHSASPRPSEQRMSSARVRLADVYVRRSMDGRHVVLAQFDVEQAGGQHLWLQLPGKQYQLAQCRVDGGVLALKSFRAGKLQLPTVSHSLPQRIEVLYFDRDTPRNSNRRIAAPVLAGVEGPLPVQRTIWTVAGSPSLIADPVSGDAVAETSRRRDVLEDRFQHIVDMLDDAASDAPAEVLDYWHRRWISRLNRLHSRIQDEKLEAMGDPSRGEARKRQINRQQARFRTLAEQQPVLPADERAEREQIDAPDILRRLSPADDRQVIRSFDGWRGEMILTLQGVTSPLWPRLLMATIILLLAGIALLIAGSRWPVRYKQELATAAVLAAGLVYWLWLIPSVFGLALVAAAAVLTLWRDWTPAAR